MPFIPNYPDTIYPDAAEPDSVDFDILLAGTRGDGVLSGCEVTSTALFAPTDIANLIQWADFTDPTTLFTDSGRTTPVTVDGDVIGGVTDKGSAGNHLSQGTGTKKPLYKTAIYGALSGARFDSTDYLEKIYTGGIISQPVTIYVVGKTTGTGGTAREFFDDTDSGQRLLLTAHTDDTYTLYAGSLMTGPAVDSSNHIFASIFNGASSKLYVGGGTASTGNPGTGAMEGMVVGISSDRVTGALIGDVAQVLVYTGVHSVTDLNNVGNYLAAHSGVTWSTAS